MTISSPDKRSTGCTAYYHHRKEKFTFMKRNITFSMLTALLMALSITSINPFSLLEKETYARIAEKKVSSASSSLSLIRPTDSWVGSVFVINVTQSTLVCVNLGTQNTAIPVPGQFIAKDHIYLIRFAPANCDISALSQNMNKFIDIKHLSDLNGQPVTVSGNAKQKNPFATPTATP